MVGFAEAFLRIAMDLGASLRLLDLSSCDSVVLVDWRFLATNALTFCVPPPNSNVKPLEDEEPFTFLDFSG